MSLRIPLQLGSPALALLVPAFLAAQAPSPHTLLPVRAVTLFSSGVGYFEHAGTVHGDATAELRFTAAQINDVLKSLTLADLDGGRIAAVTYPSEDPVARTLRSFDVDITANPDMMTLLNQLRGASVTVDVQGDHVTGTILGVESRRRAMGAGNPVDVPTLNLLTAATIRSVELPSITSLTLDDPQLQGELSKALAALAQARDADRKPIVVNFTGNGERRVRVGYVAEAPIWKASYRLILGDKHSSLQGWAIVENQTESDWNDVSLTLVSGRPISFIMDLYKPIYVQRQTVALDLYEELMPQLYRAGLANGVIGGTAGLSLSQKFDAASFSGKGVDGGIAQGRVGPSVHTARTGALFQYTIPGVTLARQKSAMLPLVTDTMSVQRLSIYNAGVLEDHPLNGVRLRNTSGKDLLQGPITVFDGGSYAGDARIEDLPAGQSRLLSYGVDLDMLVHPDSRRGIVSSIVTAKIVKGVLLVSRRQLLEMRYTIDNHGLKEKTVLVEVPILAGWKLADGMTPVETTATEYRFEQSVAAGTELALPVTQEQLYQESMRILAADTVALLTYSRNGEIPADVRAALARVASMKAALADVKAEIAARDSEIEAISTEQGRIRENMKTVDGKSQYYERLLAKLNDQESRIEALQQERAGLIAKRDAQQRAMEEYLEGLTIG